MKRDGREFTNEKYNSSYLLYGYVNKQHVDANVFMRDMIFFIFFT